MKVESEESSLVEVEPPLLTSPDFILFRFDMDEDEEDDGGSDG